MEGHLTLADYIAIAAALLTALVGIMGYLIQRRNEMLKALGESKSEAYIGFIRAVCTAMGSEEERKKGAKDFVFRRTKVLFYGSDDVIEAYRRWTLAADPKSMTETFNEMLVLMRLDCVRKSAVSREAVDAISPMKLL